MNYILNPFPTGRVLVTSLTMFESIPHYLHQLKQGNPNTVWVQYEDFDRIKDQQQVIVLFQGWESFPASLNELQQRASVVCINTSIAHYSDEQFELNELTPELLYELTKLLPVNNPIRIKIEQIKAKYTTFNWEG